LIFEISVESEIINEHSCKPDFSSCDGALYYPGVRGFPGARLPYFIRLGGCDVGCVWCDVKAGV